MLKEGYYGHCLSGEDILLHMYLMMKSIVAGYEKKMSPMDQKFSRKVRAVEGKMITGVKHSRYVIDCQAGLGTHPMLSLTS